MQTWLNRSTGIITPLLATDANVSQLVGLEDCLEAMVQFPRNNDCSRTASPLPKPAAMGGALQ